MTCRERLTAALWAKTWMPTNTNEVTGAAQDTGLHHYVERLGVLATRRQSARSVGSLSYGAQTQHTPVAPTGTPHAPVFEVTEHPGVVGLAT
jgi:hypothetical protein